MGNKKRFIAGILLLAVYAFFFASATLFVHVHVFSDGKIIHSHPFNRANPSHNLNQINLVEVLDSAAYEESETLVAPCPIPEFFHKAISVAEVVDSSKPTILSFSLRAPPVRI